MNLPAAFCLEEEGACYSMAGVVRNRPRSKGGDAPWMSPEGFVVIESGVELDVVAVYTAAGMDGEVRTLHTERVPPRAI